MRNSKIHKRVCTTDPSLKRFVPVEMAIERSLAKQPPLEQAPKEATCYICLEGDGASPFSKLLRGCACRGDSAGFVHLECLTELAKSKEASGDFDAIFNSWTSCGNCKQEFQGALDLEMARRFWRRYRSGSATKRQRYHSTKLLAICLGHNGEVHAANQLLDEASIIVGNNKEPLLTLKLLRTAMLIANDQDLEALGLLQAILPEAKQFTTNPTLYPRTMHQIAEVLLHLDRNQEAHKAAAELVAFANAKFGQEDPTTLIARSLYGEACAKLGRVKEAKANFEDALNTQTRILGREHPQTQTTRQQMRKYGFA